MSNQFRSITPKGVESLLKTLAEADPRVGSFRLGDVWETDTVVDDQYPLVTYELIDSVVVPKGAMDYVRWNINVYCFTPRRKDWENVIDSFAETHIIISDLVVRLKKERLFTKDWGFLFDDPITIDFVIKKGKSDLVGVCAQVRFMTPVAVTLCDMPVDALPDVGLFYSASTITATSTYLTCASLSGCSVIQSIQASIDALASASGGTSFDCAALLQCPAFIELSASTESNSTAIGVLSGTISAHDVTLADLSGQTGAHATTLSSLSGMSAGNSSAIAAHGVSLASLSATTSALAASSGHTHVAPGVNAYTAGTISSTVVGVIGSPSFTSVTASNFISGATNISDLFAPASVTATYVQPGLNITTGGTASRPIVNVAGSVTLTGMTATSGQFSSSLILTSAGITIGGATITGAPDKPTVIGNGVFNYIDSTINLGRNMVFDIASDATRFRSNILADLAAGARVTGSLSATTYYSGSSELGSLFATSTNYVQPGLNITTGGTPSRPVVNLAGTLVVTAVTATDYVNSRTFSASSSISSPQFVSGSTNLNAVFAPIGVVNRYVQPGTNITTGGTAIAPTVNLVASPSVTHLIASGIVDGATLSGDTLYIGADQQVSRRSVRLSSNFVTSSATYVDVTGFSFAVTAGETYAFDFIIAASSSGTSTGMAFALNGPAATLITYTMSGVQSAGALTQHATGYDFGSAGANVAAANVNYTCWIRGTLVPLSSGTLIVRAIRGGTANNITVKAGSSGMLSKVS